MQDGVILTNLLLCGLLGLIGQGLRVIVGLKKLCEEAAATAAEQPAATATTAKAVYEDRFDGRQLGLSLFIGFIAGCLASFTQDNASTAMASRDVQLAIVAAGYAGTDFIEGIIKKIIPGK